MKFTATEEQVKQIFCNAINASVPIGLGLLHYEDKQYTPSEIQADSDGRFDADYFHGRMVKLGIIPMEEDGKWEIIRPSYPPNIEYQSWATKYPSLEELVSSVIS